MLEGVLKGNIQILENVKDWKDSINIASAPLLEKGMIEKNYVEAMIKKIEDIGFYVVLGENLAMPHSRPEDGVNKTGLSFLKLNNPVNYGDNQVKLIFILAAKDSTAHIDILSELSDLFQNEEHIEELLKSETTEEVIEVLKNY